MIKIILSSVIAFSFIACGGSEDQSKSTTEKIVNTAAPKIEIVENKNAKEIKVEQKDKKEHKENYQKKYYYDDYNIKSSYDPNSQPANKDASVRIKPRTSNDAYMHVRSPYEKIKISMIVKKLSQKFIVKCSACHDDYANGIIGPSLLDKNADEIFENIADFRSGKKTNVLMDDLIKMMDEDEIREIADEIFEFNKKIKELRGKK